MKKTTITLLILFSIPLYAADDYCAVEASPIKSRVLLPFTPSYFISADPNGRYAGVIHPGGYNTVINLETGSTTRVRGDYDPVFTPDGDYLTIPGGRFYDMNEIAAHDTGSDNSARNVSAAYDPNKGGVYQSIGITKEENGTKTYRYLDDESGASFFDVSVNTNTGQFSNSTNYRRACTEASRRDTPMLSKDGRYMSLLNFETDTTQIWKINDDGSCDMMTDLGVPTGKVGFDFERDGTPRITFHVDENTTDWRYFSGVNRSQRKNVYVMNLAKINPGEDEESWMPTTIAKVNTADAARNGTGSYYPRFQADGDILMVTALKDNQADYALDIVDPDTLNYVDFNSFTFSNGFISNPCREFNQDDYNQLLGLGYLWRNVCHQGNQPTLRALDLLMIPMGLDREACLKLIDKKWDSVRGNISYNPYTESVGDDDRREFDGAALASITKEELQLACPADSEKEEAVSQEAIAATAEEEDLNAKAIIMRRCAGCHESSNISPTDDGYVRSETNGAYIDFHNINPREDIMTWRYLIFNPGTDYTKAMPPVKDYNNDGSITKDEFERNLQESFTEEELEILRKELIEIESGEREWSTGNE